VELSQEQGDQNGRIFARWVIVFFGQFLEKKSKNGQTILGYFYPR
jgi:hypothetical protein